MSKIIEFSKLICKSQKGKRLDQAISFMLPHYSRSCIKKWIIEKKVMINNITVQKPKKKSLGMKNVLFK